MPGSLWRFGPAQRTGEARSDHTGIDQDVQARGLDQPADVADKRQPHLAAIDTRRRGVGMRARRPFGPGLPLPVPAELPAQHFAERFRRRAVGIEKLPAVEMIGERSGIGFLGGASWPDRQQIGLLLQGGRPAAGLHESAMRPRLSLTFGACGGLTRANPSERSFFSTRRPVPEAGGQRPTARCALGRKIVWFIGSAPCRDRKKVVITRESG